MNFNPEIKELIKISLEAETIKFRDRFIKHLGANLIVAAQFPE